MENKSIEYINDLAASGEKFIFITDFLSQKWEVIPWDQIQASNVYFTSPNLNFSPLKDSEESVTLEILESDEKIYKKNLQKVIHLIQEGHSYLLNYTDSTLVTTAHSLEEIYRASRAKYRLFFQDEFVCFSPESFVSIQDGVIKSYPMKGTIDADEPQAEIKILEDLKEKYEHNTIVDLLRNDLSLLAENVQVERYRYISEVKSRSKNLLQVSSEISGKLPVDWQKNLGTIISKILPAGSISGAPKKRTVEIIQEYETRPRGFYTGILGIFDGQNFDSAVLIRFIQKTDKKNQYHYFSGGGITALSDIDKEYQEMLHKVYVPTF